MSTKSKLLLALVGCFTLGLAPYKPEPHLFGKIRWIMGGGEGMMLADYFDLVMHSLPWLFLLYVVASILRGGDRGNESLIHALTEPNVKIIDVRETHEVASGMAKGAINMPLSKLNEYTNELLNMEGSKVLYCKSGMRSARAIQLLKKKGVTGMYNGGGISKIKSLMK